jgi:hypothetical protein
MQGKRTLPTKRKKSTCQAVPAHTTFMIQVWFVTKQKGAPHGQPTTLRAKIRASIRRPKAPKNRKSCRAFAVGTCAAHWRRALAVVLGLLQFSRRCGARLAVAAAFQAVCRMSRSGCFANQLGQKMHALGLKISCGVAVGLLQIWPRRYLAGPVTWPGVGPATTFRVFFF